MRKPDFANRSQCFDPFPFYSFPHSSFVLPSASTLSEMPFALNMPDNLPLSNQTIPGIGPANDVGDDDGDVTDPDASSARKPFRSQRCGGQLLKYFILTPTAHYINSNFAQPSQLPCNHNGDDDDDVDDGDYNDDDTIEPPYDTDFTTPVRQRLSPHVIPLSAPRVNLDDIFRRNDSDVDPTNNAPNTDSSLPMIIPDRSVSFSLKLSSSSSSSLFGDILRPLSDTPAMSTPSTIASSPPEEYGAPSGVQRAFSPSPQGSHSGTPMSGSSRYDSSLGLVTKRFVTLLQNTPDNALDLNYAANELGVQKRRMYDVTNVLEGIGLIVKSNKNQVSWNENPPTTFIPSAADDGGENDESDSERIGSPPRITNTAAEAAAAVTGRAVRPIDSPPLSGEALRQENQRLKEEEQKLDGLIDYLSRMTQSYTPPSDSQSSSLAHSEDIVRNTHVRFADITSLPMYRQDTVIGIRAPAGTSLEVPDPDQGMRPGSRRFEIYLSSKGEQEPTAEQPSGGGSGGGGGPINVYLIRYEGGQNRHAMQERGSFRSTTVERRSDSRHDHGLYPHQMPPPGQQHQYPGPPSHGPLGPPPPHQQHHDQQQRQPHPHHQHDPYYGYPHPPPSSQAPQPTPSPGPGQRQWADPRVAPVAPASSASVSSPSPYSLPPESHPQYGYGGEVPWGPPPSQPTRRSDDPGHGPEGRGGYPHRHQHHPQDPSGRPSHPERRPESERKRNADEAEMRTASPIMRKRSPIPSLKPRSTPDRGIHDLDNPFGPPPQRFPLPPPPPSYARGQSHEGGSTTGHDVGPAGSESRPLQPGEHSPSRRPYGGPPPYDMRSLSAPMTPGDPHQRQHQYPPPPGSASYYPMGAPSPPSTHQYDLMTMPLQSPSSRGWYPLPGAAYPSPSMMYPPGQSPRGGEGPPYVPLPSLRNDQPRSGGGDSGTPVFSGGWQGHMARGGRPGPPPHLPGSEVGGDRSGRSSAASASAPPPGPDRPHSGGHAK